MVGFLTPTGKVLAIHREANETRIWFLPAAPPKLDGVRLMDNPSNGNSNINGPLLSLRSPTTLRVEVDSAGALELRLQCTNWRNSGKPISARRLIARLGLLPMRPLRPGKRWPRSR